jgi:large subunit ribosomal protein L22
MRTGAGEEGVVDKRLLEAVERVEASGRDRFVKARDPRARITAEMVGFTVSVYDGLRHVPVAISEEMVDDRLMDHMPVRARASFVRVSPSKLRRYARLVRGKPVSEAGALLSVISSPSAQVISKTIASAASNAENNVGLDKEDLVVTDVFCDDAFVMPRLRPRARGMPGRVRKRTSHLTVYVAPAPTEEEEEE